MFGAPIPPSERPPPLRSIRQIPSSAPDVPWSHDVFTYRTGPLAGTNMASSRLEDCGGRWTHRGRRDAHSSCGGGDAGGRVGRLHVHGRGLWPGEHPDVRSDRRRKRSYALHMGRCSVGTAPKGGPQAGVIQGAAIAVSADTLLADCRATAGRSSVGLVRHNKYRIAKVTHDWARQVCLLTVSEGPLSPAAGYRRASPTCGSASR